MNNVSELEISEGIRVNSGSIEDLVALIGDGEAARRVGGTFDELGEALSVLTCAWRAGDADRVIGCARELVTPTGQIGLDLLQRVARDVVQTGEAGDAAAFSATVHRLVRLIETALTVAYAPQPANFDPLEPIA